MKSIMHDKSLHTCYICAIEGDYDEKAHLEEHHVIHGTANRKLSERWGLKVYLCPCHHRMLHGKGGHGIDERLKDEAQQAFEREWPGKDFKKLFGKNFKAGEHKKEYDKRQANTEDTFRIVPEGFEELPEGLENG